MAYTTKTHELNRITVDHIEISYFYTRERRDTNGNSRFRVYIIDPDAPAVYEKIFKCYEFEIPERVQRFAEGGNIMILKHHIMRTNGGY